MMCVCVCVCVLNDDTKHMQLHIKCISHTTSTIHLHECLFLLVLCFRSLDAPDNPYNVYRVG